MPLPRTICVSRQCSYATTHKHQIHRGTRQPPKDSILKAIKAWHIESLSHRDLTAIVVNINNHETLILSAYLDSKLKVVQPWLTAAMTFATNRRYAIIIGMDSNCHSELYGLETYKRGEHLEDFIGQCNLKVENQGNITTFQASIGSSIIDVTLTARLSVTVTNWRVSTNPNFFGS